jgi:peptidoglycan/LPS O-acetylase OafA/YrhL
MYYGPSPWTLWFITMLALFYLATPLLLKLVERPVDYFLFSGGLYLLTLVLLTTFKTVDERVLLYFPCYVLGIYCSQYGIRTSVVNVTSALLMMGGWALLELIVTNSWMFSLFRNTLMVVSFSYLILVISHLNEKNFKRLTIVSLLSYSSFTMYLFHRPVYIDLTALYFPENEQLQVLYLSTVCLVAVVCVSWAVQKAYDMGYAAISKRGSS